MECVTNESTMARRRCVSAKLAHLEAQRTAADAADATARPSHYWLSEAICFDLLRLHQF